MTSKAIGSLLILGTILTMGVWMAFDLGTDSMAPADKLNVLIANKTQVQIVSLVTTLGFVCLIIGLHYLSRNLSNHILTEIGGLLLIALVPLLVALNMSDLAALEAEKEFSNGADILTAASAFEYGFIALMAGVFLMGIGLAIERKIANGIVGALLSITSAIAIVSFSGISAGPLDFIGWLGTWALFLVTGILVFMQKES